LDLWWTEWHCDKLFSKYFSFPLSVSLHHCYIVTHLSICDGIYTVHLLSFRTGIIKSICVKEMTLLLFSFRHTSLLTVNTDLHHHTASGCLCRSHPLHWCLMYLSRLSGCPKSSQRCPFKWDFTFRNKN